MSPEPRFSLRGDVAGCQWFLQDINDEIRDTLFAEQFREFSNLFICSGRFDDLLEHKSRCQKAAHVSRQRPMEIGDLHFQHSPTTFALIEICIQSDMKFLPVRPKIPAPAIERGPHRMEVSHHESTARL